MLPQLERSQYQPCSSSARHRRTNPRTTRTKPPTQCCSSASLLLIYMKNRNYLLRIYQSQPCIYKTCGAAPGLATTIL